MGRRKLAYLRAVLSDPAADVFHTLHILGHELHGIGRRKFYDVADLNPHGAALLKIS